MSQTAGIIVFLIILNSFLGLAPQFGIAGNYTFQYANNVNITAVQQFANCPSGVTSCSSNLGSFSALSVVIAFGDFLWSLAKIMLFLPVVIALPAYFLVNDFYAPVALAAVYNIAFWVVFAFWINELVSGRYSFDVP
jgi:hypothetical protein